MGSSHLKREVAGIALSALALFLAGALATLAWAQLRGGVDVAANVGGVGRFLAEPLVGFLGWAGAWLAPVAAAVAALRAFGLFGRDDGDADRGRAWFVFTAGLALILPVVVALALGVTTASGDAPAAAGLWGSFVAAYWRDWFGGFGAWIGILFVLSVLTAATLAWNPIRVLVGHRAPRGGAGAIDAGGAAAGARSSAAIEVERALALEPPPEEMPELQGLGPGGSGLANGDADDPAEDRQAGRSRKGKKSKAAVAEERDEEIAAAIESTREPDVLGDELPSPELLTAPNPPAGDTQRRELDAMGLKLMDALRTFRVDGELVGRTTGPTVTQYEIEPAPGVKVRQFANLANDLALAMRAQSIRVVAPIPGRGAVGVEVPNPTPEMVRFRELVEAAEFSARGKFALPIGLGKDLEGRPVIADLAKMPHLLIAGATGSGKSVCVNTIITSLVYRHTPRTLRFLMVDPKMVELSVYNTLPHLRHKVITDNRDAAAVLKWAVLEMQERYELLAANGCRNLQDFNRRAQEGAELKLPKRPDVAFEDTVYRGGILPYIVVVIDEMADLMMTVQGEVETPIAMLAQKARAIGIHLILATQRPSVNVITGLIKANFPSRIAFRVASQVDSRTIIDGAGAEMLLGNGDMLFIPPGKSEPSRLQGAFLSSEDTERLMGWYEGKKAARRAALAEQGLVLDEPLEAEEDIIAKVRQMEAIEAGKGDDGDADEGERDKLFREAAEVVIQHQQGSTSLLQRRLKVGYGRAARIIDQLHNAGVLGPPDGSKPRDVLAGLEDLDRICGGKE